MCRAGDGAAGKSRQSYSRRITPDLLTSRSDTEEYLTQEVSLGFIVLYISTTSRVI